MHEAPRAPRFFSSADEYTRFCASCTSSPHVAAYGEPDGSCRMLFGLLYQGCSGAVLRMMALTTMLASLTLQTLLPIGPSATHLIPTATTMPATTQRTQLSMSLTRCSKVLVRVTEYWLRNPRISLNMRGFLADPRSTHHTSDSRLAFGALTHWHSTPTTRLELNELNNRRRLSRKQPHGAAAHGHVTSAASAGAGGNLDDPVAWRGPGARGLGAVGLVGLRKHALRVRAVLALDEKTTRCLRRLPRGQLEVCAAVGCGLKQSERRNAGPAGRTIDVRLRVCSACVTARDARGTGSWLSRRDVGDHPGCC